MLPRTIEPSVPLTGTIDSAAWAVIIPAAGRGSRLRSELPKVLYPVLGKPLLQWLYQTVHPVCQSIVVVLSPANVQQVQRWMDDTLPGAFKIAIQPEPKGMADAILYGLESVATPNVATLWGDQILLREESLRRCMLAHQSQSNPGITLATLQREQPYIDIRRDESGRIQRVDQAREKEIHRPIGESDCGLFLFQTHVLRQVLARAQGLGQGIGKQTGEFNLLELLPLFEAVGSGSASVRLEDSNEALGINTPEDADMAENILRQRNARCI